jgi:hypothetical protein
MGDDDKPRRLRSLRDRLPERGPLTEEDEQIPEGRSARISWPIAFIVATIAVCLTTVYIFSKWPEWQCKREGGIWFATTPSENLPDNYCQYP